MKSKRNDPILIPRGSLSVAENFESFVVFWCTVLLFQLFNMASCLTAWRRNTQSEKFEFRRQEVSSTESGDENDGCYDDYVLSNFIAFELFDFLAYSGNLRPDIESVFDEVPKKAEQHPATDKGDEEQKMAHVEMTARILQNHSFNFKLWLHRLLLPDDLVEEKDKNTNLVDSEHAIYSAQAIIAQYLSFIKTKENYDAEEQKTLLLYHQNRLEEACKELLAEEAKAGFEMSEEDKARGDCPNSRLCFLLGLRLDFLDRLKEIDPQNRDHRPVKDWITDFLWNNFESLSISEKSSLNSKLLVSIGFDPMSSAIETILARASDRSQHIEACEWAERFINDEFKYNSLLCQQSRKFPFESNQKSERRFQLSSTSAEVGPHISQDLSSVVITNVEVKESEMSQTTRKKLSDYGLDDQHPYFFHGTDHESASNILLEGIDLCYGRQKRDFSSGSGFYLTKNLDEAVSWSKSTTAKPALLIFKGVDYVDHNRKLTLSENDRQWNELVTSFRMDNVTATDEESLVRKYDFIEGPVAMVTRSDTSSDVVLVPKPSSYQMCLISDDFADEFHKNLHSILFYNIS